MLPGSLEIAPADAVAKEAEGTTLTTEDRVEEVDDNTGDDPVFETRSARDLMAGTGSIEAGETCGPDTAGFVDGWIRVIG